MLKEYDMNDQDVVNTYRQVLPHVIDYYCKKSRRSKLDATKRVEDHIRDMEGDWSYDFTEKAYDFFRKIGNQRDVNNWLISYYQRPNGHAELRAEGILVGAKLNMEKDPMIDEFMSILSLAVAETYPRDLMKGEMPDMTAYLKTKCKCKCPDMIESYEDMQMHADCCCECHSAWSSGEWIALKIPDFKRNFARMWKQMYRNDKKFGKLKNL